MNLIPFNDYDVLQNTAVISVQWIQYLYRRFNVALQCVFLLLFLPINRSGLSEQNKVSTQNLYAMR